MKPAEYDAWYDSPRGRWIGQAEYQLLLDQLVPKPGDNVLDTGADPRRPYVLPRSGRSIMVASKRQRQQNGQPQQVCFS